MKKEPSPFHICYNKRMNKKIRISYKSFFTMAIVYLALPVVLFFLGYLKIYISIPLSVILIASVVLAVRDCTKGPDKTITEVKDVGFPAAFIAATAVFAIVVTVTNGVGEYMWGPYDHAFRRAILNDLIDYKWPIVYDSAKQSNEIVRALLNLNGDQGFVYYFTYWMPAALIGKIAGFTAGNIALIIWNSIGIFITITGMCIYIKRATYGTLVMYLCFGGLDVIPYLINEIIPYDGWFWIDGWVSHISYISNFNNLENVYHQVVPCYLIITMLLLARNNRSIGLTAGLIFAYSPWATFGMIVPAAVRLLSGDLRAEDRKKSVLNIFTFNNLAVPAVLLFVFGTYYSAKSDSMHDKGFVWDYYGSIPVFLLVYVLFLAVEVLPSFIFVYRRQRKNPMLWAAVAMLLICPLYKITESNDFTMRASMPALFILCIFMAQRISDYTAEDILLKRKNEKRKGVKEHIKMALFALVLIGMSYVTYYMTTVIYTSTFLTEERFTYDIVSFGDIAKPDYAEKIKDQFFVENPSETFFFKYLALSSHPQQ
ncbi:hypothetical protein SAMN02910456_00776 [Ruminococcaceae bacterium YRB3002]|nr:hypothetical protein SAMN02910456_00776 [Ruminococcaceae bacterium YRB3002]